MSMMDVALELAAAGWKVFPCHASGDKAKSPRTTHGHLDATTDPEQIRKWWTLWPDSMIGAPVPDPWLVIDIDPRNGGSYEALIAALGPLPQTLTVWSGRGDGGRHLYFERPSGTLWSGNIPKGIDLKRDGYCILPPSIHPATGQPYTWEIHPAATLPMAARNKLRRPESNLRPVSRSGVKGSLVAFLDNFPDQGINNALFWAANRAAESGTLDAQFDEFLAKAIELGESPGAARATLESARNTSEGAR